MNDTFRGLHGERKGVALEKHDKRQQKGRLHIRFQQSNVFGNQFTGNLISVRLYNSDFYEAFDSVKNSPVGIEVFNGEDNFVISYFTEFSRNKLDVSIRKSGNMMLFFPKLKSLNVLDRRIQKDWSDDRGKLRERGSVVKIF